MSTLAGLAAMLLSIAAALAVLVPILGLVPALAVSLFVGWGCADLIEWAYLRWERKS